MQNCCEIIFHEIDSCLIKLNNRENELNELVIACKSTFSMKWLIPRLNDFNNQNHSFKIKIKTINNTINFKEVDLAISRDDTDCKEYIYIVKLINEIMFFIQNPSQIGNNILISTSRPNLWQNLLKISHIREKIICLEYKKLDHFYLCIEACLSGLGATIASGYMIENELKNHKVEPITTPFHDGSSYYLLSSSPFEEDYRKLVFKNWLLEELCKSKNFLDIYF